MGSNGLIYYSWDIRLDNEMKKLFLINSIEKSLNLWNVLVDIIILIKLVVLWIFILCISFWCFLKFFFRDFVVDS